MLQKFKELSEYLLIGVLATIPIVIVVQVVLIIKSLIASTFFGVYGYVDSYTFTFILLVVVVFALSYIGYSIVKNRRSIIISTAELLVEKIPFLNSVYRVSKKVISMFSASAPIRIAGAPRRALSSVASKIACACISAISG